MLRDGANICSTLRGNNCYLFRYDHLELKLKDHNFSTIHLNIMSFHWQILDLLTPADNRNLS